MRQRRNKLLDELVLVADSGVVEKEPQVVCNDLGKRKMLVLAE